MLIANTLFREAKSSQNNILEHLQICLWFSYEDNLIHFTGDMIFAMY